MRTVILLYISPVVHQSVRMVVYLPVIEIFEFTYLILYKKRSSIFLFLLLLYSSSIQQNIYNLNTQYTPYIAFSILHNNFNPTYTVNIIAKGVGILQ